MKRLSKDQQKTRADHVATLEVKAAAVSAAVAEVNALIEGKLAEAINDYNGALDDVETFRDEIVQEMSDYYDERTEKWQEGEAGQNYSSWKDAWEAFDLSPLDDVTLLDEPDAGHRDELDNLPDEPDA